MKPNGYIVPDLSGCGLHWKLIVDGNDLIVQNALATWFAAQKR